MVRYIAENEVELSSKQIEQTEPPKGYLALLLKGRISQSLTLHETVNIGRDKNNAIVIADNKVSRSHAQLILVDDGFMINDLQSSNGTYLNNILIKQPTRLKDHDKIMLGDATFVFTISELVPDTQIDFEPAPEPKEFSSSSMSVSAKSSMIFLENQTILWIIFGCMTLTIIILLVIIAFLLGMFFAFPHLG